MAQRKNYMALDFGIGGGVAVAGGFDGGRLDIEVLHRFDIRATTMLEVAYWDFPAMIIHAKRGLSAYTAQRGPELAGVGCNSWGGDFGLLDKTGHILANPVHHLDARTQGAVEKLSGIFPDRSLYQRSGVHPRRESTLYQLYTMAQSNSPLLDKAVTLLLMADLVSYFLSGTPVQEYTLATTTGMYDAETRDWSRDIILGSKIPPGMVPEIVAPGTVIGNILDGVALECGLASSVPVIAPASHGMAGATAAIPAAGDDWVCITSNYWTQVAAELTAPVINDASFSAGFSNLGGVDGTISLQKEMLGFGFLEGCLEVWSREDLRDVTRAEALALAESAPPTGVHFNLADERLSLEWNKPAALNAILAESGQPALGDRGALVRAFIDNLALGFRHAVSQLQELTNRKYSVIHFLGRGSDSPLLGQAIADATGLPVKVGPVEARAIGNVVMQMLALGDIGSVAEGRELVRRSFEVTDYEPRNAAEWGAAYEKFVQHV